jgi:hypothetical protein
VTDDESVTTPGELRAYPAVRSARGWKTAAFEALSAMAYLIPGYCAPDLSEGTTGARQLQGPSR